MFAALQDLLVSSCGCFHGQTLDVISMSCDEDTTHGFGPLVPGHLKIDFQATNGLKKPLKVIYLFDSAKHICCFLFEPIQAEVEVCVDHVVSGIDCSEHILFTARN
jgi:ornithine--oxo-acid transaminase